MLKIVKSSIEVDKNQEDNQVLFKKKQIKEKMKLVSEVEKVLRDLISCEKFSSINEFNDFINGFFYCMFHYKCKRYKDIDLSIDINEEQKSVVFTFSNEVFARVLYVMYESKE